MYGKLINNELIIAPRKLPDGDFIVYNPPADLYLANGYFPVEFTNPPDDPPEGYHYESGWEQTEEAIVQTWTLVQDPDEVDPAEAWEYIFGGDGE